MAREDTLYVRNRRPNGLVLNYAGTRHLLEHRGHRADSTALPAEAANDATISRFLKQGYLEKISRDAFMKLGARTVDVRPNEFLTSNVGKNQSGVPMVAADADTTRTPSVLTDKAIHDAADPSPKWAGELMSTEEELEVYDYDSQSSQANYPSKNRD
jgi:hypothetical protein